MSQHKHGDESGGMPHSEAVDLKELVDFSDGSVVSRTIIKGAKGTVTLFSFDKDQGLSEHSAPFDAMVQILEGSAEITIGDVTVTPTAGQTVMMPADIPHALNAPEPFKMLLVMIRD